MQITPIGWLLIPLGVLLAVIRPRWLYLLTVFLLPFTATAVINVGTGQNASGLQASMYLGSLLLARYCFALLGTAYLPLPRAGRGGIAWLALFVAVAAISLVMPVWIDGRVQVPTPYLLDLSTQPLHLKSTNITGVLFLLFGCLFAYLVVGWTRYPVAFRQTLKAFLAGSAFSAGWALVELACNVSGIPYPAFIFNTSTSPSAGGYREVLEGGIFRLSSVSVEPSIFAQTLLIALALYLPFVLGPRRAFSKTLDRVLFALMLAVLLLTTSSTAYVGILVGILLVLWLLTVRRVLQLKHVVIPMVGCGLAGILYASVPVVQQIAESVLISKGGGYSALERLMTIRNSYQMFLKYPLLGIGWASITSHDLIVNILANCGFLGLAAFAIAMYFIFRALYRSIRSRRTTLAAVMQPDLALHVALAVTLITCIISGALFVFPFFWFLCGLAIAAPDLMAKEATIAGFAVTRYQHDPHVSPRR
jgi:hypothetical protein